MCGIAGIWSKHGGPVYKENLSTMLSRMKHRGPDVQRIWTRESLGLGHCRLKILDLSDAANQPFTDGQDVLVFNGEIFNYKLLKKELSSQFCFSTKSDTEVLFRALQVWGVEALSKIEGQFTFAFFRDETRTLLLARDHVGICPLYVYEDDKEILFASEIKPILALKTSALNSQAVIDYFAYRYNIQNGLTLFDGIERFPPAHYRIIDLKTGRVTTDRYWSLHFQEMDLSIEKIQNIFNELLDAEIASQSLADVPVGIYLSGGIDSRALLYGFSQTVDPIYSFTITFSSDDEDLRRVNALESEIAFQKNIFSFTPDCFQDIEDVVFSLEEPFGDLIISANYFLPQHASEKVKVVLSGEGGDEAFVGYDHQRAFLKMATIGKADLVRFLFRLLLKICPTWLIARANTYPGGFGADEHRRLEEVVRNLSRPCEAYIRLVSLFNNNELELLFSRSFLNHSPHQPDREPIERIFSDSKYVWQAIMKSEIEQLTLIVNLLKQDRFGMRFSLEGRVPFVSRKVLEFAASLPLDRLVSKINKHYLIYYSSSQPLEKRPFSIFASPVYKRVLSYLMEQYVDQKSVHDCGILSQDAVTRLEMGLKKGQMLAVKKAMAVIVFMIWWKKFRTYLRS